MIGGCIFDAFNFSYYSIFMYHDIARFIFSLALLDLLCFVDTFLLEFDLVLIIILCTCIFHGSGYSIMEFFSFVLRAY